MRAKLTVDKDFNNPTNRTPAGNSTFAIGGVSCSEDSFVVTGSSVFRMNICAEKPAHRKSAKRYSQLRWTRLRTNPSSLTNKNTTITWSNSFRLFYLSYLSRLFHSGRQIKSTTAYTINWLVWHGGLSETEKDFLYGLDDDYSLANEKIAGSLQEIEKWTLNFLSIYKEFTLTNFKDWKEINKQVDLNIQKFADQQKNKADT